MQSLGFQTRQAYCGDEVKKRNNTEDFKEMQKKKRADRAIKDKEAAEEDEEKKDAEEENKEAAEEAEEKKDAEEKNKGAAQDAEEKQEADEEDEEDIPELVDALDEDEDGMKKVFMQQVLVEDPMQVTLKMRKWSKILWRWSQVV